MYLWWQVWKPQHHHQAHSICVNWAYASIIWVTFDELLMLFMDLNMNPCYVTPCSPIYTYVSRHIRVCYCKLNTSTKELVLSYFYCHEMSLKWWWSVIYVHSIFLMCLYIYISQLLVTKWLTYKEIVNPSAPPPPPPPPPPHISLLLWCTLVASLMSLMASLVTTSRMQQCFNVLIDIYHEFLLLFYCCVLLEIKLTTTTIKADGIQAVVRIFDTCSCKSKRAVKQTVQLWVVRVIVASCNVTVML